MKIKQTLEKLDTTSLPSYEAGKISKVTASFRQVEVSPPIEGAPLSPYVQVALIGGSASDRSIDKIDAFGHYIEVSKGVELEFAEGFSRFHEELYAACEKDPDELIAINVKGACLNLAIRGEDAPHPSRPSVELLFMNTAEDMEACRGSVLELAGQVTDAFRQRFGWDLVLGVDVNIYFRGSAIDMWDSIDI